MNNDNAIIRWSCKKHPGLNFIYQKIQEMRRKTTAHETYLLILPSYFYTSSVVLLSSYLCLLKPSVESFVLEFVVVVVPIILNISILSNYNLEIIFCYSILLVLLGAVVKKCGIAIDKSVIIEEPPRTRLVTCEIDLEGNQRIGETARNNCITNARSTINLISVICILAVDFHSIFPSRFVKTATTGFSLMDVGVGLYVYANGVVAPEVRGKEDPIKSTFKGCAILIFLGIIRLASMTAIDYHVSELEYGLQWNFFITLAVTKLLSSFILDVISIKYVYIIAIFLTIAHEMLLELYVKHWVFSEVSRHNFVPANREGIVSSIGFIALYLFSVYFGYCLSTTYRSLHISNLKFFFWSASTLCLTFILNNFSGVSRRLASAGYVFWILFIGISMTWLFYLGESVQKIVSRDRLKQAIYCPHIFEAINYNGLVFFLVGNLLTACVNLSVDTSKYTAFGAIMIVSVYTFLTCLSVLWLYVKQIKLKL